MINICFYCNPKYDNNKRVGTAPKDIDVVTQAIILYNSIKCNWKSFEYDITLFHNKNIKWSDEDWTRITDLQDLNIISVDKGDHPNIPWQTRLPCFSHKLKRKGTHRLVLDCDMIALKEPKFDLTCDWQGMYSIDGFLPHIIYQTEKNKNPVVNGASKKSGKYPIYPYYDNKELNGNLDQLEKIKKFMRKKGIELKNEIDKVDNNKNIQRSYLHTEYHLSNKTNLYPHFNLGAILLKEELCSTFADQYKYGYQLTEIGLAPHCALEYVGTYILRNLSNNWKPFEKGFNYLSDLFSEKELLNYYDNISLIHYPGAAWLGDFKTPVFQFIDTIYKKKYNESLLKYTVFE